MFSNLYDTIREGDSELLAMEGMTYSLILHGFHPAMTMTHAIDSGFLLSEVTGENRNGRNGFSSILKRGCIKFSRYTMPDGKPATPVTYLGLKLNESIRDDSKKEFIFSNPFLSFLWQDGVSPNDRKKVYEYMEKAISPLISSSLNRANDLDLGTPCDVLDSLGKRNKVNAYLKSVCYLHYNAIDPKNFLKYKSPERTLFEMVCQKLEELANRNENTDDNVYSCFLNKLREDGRGTTLTRSDMYVIIKDRLDCVSGEDKISLRSVVDLEYNTQLASSIEDNEKDILVYRSDSQTELACKEIDKREDSEECEQLSKLIDKSSNSLLTGSTPLNWEMLNSILDHANQHNGSWKEKIDEALKQYDVNRSDIFAFVPHFLEVADGILGFFGLLSTGSAPEAAIYTAKILHGIERSAKAGKSLASKTMARKGAKRIQTALDENLFAHQRNMEMQSIALITEDVAR